jgi:hypothetical protein
VIDSLAIYPNKSEFSRFERDNSVIMVRVVPTPASAPDETVTVSLVRKDGKAVASREICFGTGNYPKGEVVSFDLASLVDADGYPLVTTGDYVLRAGVRDITVSVQVIISILTVEKLKKSFLAGVPLRQTDVLQAVKQPQLVTGITIKGCSEGMKPGLYVLAFNAGAGTLQFNSGAVVEIASGPGTEILPGDNGEYIEVDIDPFELPSGDAAEGIMIDYGRIEDDILRREIAGAVAEIERAIGGFIETKRVATAPYFDNPGPEEFFDLRGEEAAYYRREAFSYQSLSWRVQLPYINVQKVSLLEGYFGTGKSMQLNDGTYVMNERMGEVEVLPQGGQLSYIITFLRNLSYWGIREVITDFWRYKAVVGLPETKPDILQAVGYAAAIPVLTVAGQARRGGKQSESFSKDGVSRSSSYGGNGMYGATIVEFRNWLKENKPKLRQKYGTITMTVL